MSTIITPAQITAAAEELAEHTLHECADSQVHVHKTPSGLTWQEIYISYGQEQGMAFAIQEALDGEPFRPWVYGLGGWADARFGTRRPELSAEALRINRRIGEEANVIVARFNRAAHDEALRRDAYAGSELVYTTSS